MAMAKTGSRAALETYYRPLLGLFSDSLVLTCPVAVVPKLNRISRRQCQMQRKGGRKHLNRFLPLLHKRLRSGASSEELKSQLRSLYDKIACTRHATRDHETERMVFMHRALRLVRNGPYSSPMGIHAIQKIEVLATTDTRSRKPASHERERLC